ncbi:MAG: glycerol-3-phosphate dehydrogenase, partial [Candidatus Bipolaricaulota bacterium]|nr:glycerol-3-phosphate dehydrogenase [Candidatus Bipolaricaulota bacterium]
MRFAVLGAGGWGTAFSRFLANAGHETTLWVRSPDRAEIISRMRENEKYLPGVRLPLERLVVTHDLEQASR